MKIPRHINVRSAGAKRSERHDVEVTPNPSRELVWTLPKPLPVLNLDTAPNLPDFSAIQPPRSPPEDTCEDDGEFADEFGDDS